MTNPLQSVDPLAPLLLRERGGLAVPLRYRSGRVLTWNQATGENEIQVDGETFTNLPVSAGSYVGIVEGGDTVTLYSTTDERGITTYGVAALVLTPPNKRLARAGLRLGYTHEWRFGMSGDAPGSIGDFPGFTTPARLLAASSESVLECTWTGTFYGASSNGAFDAYVRVDGVDYWIGGLREATPSTNNSHTPYAFVGIAPTLTAGTKSITPRWVDQGAGTARVDASDFMNLTIRETFRR